MTQRPLFKTLALSALLALTGTLCVSVPAQSAPLVHAEASTSDSLSQTSTLASPEGLKTEFGFYPGAFITFRFAPPGATLVVTDQASKPVSDDGLKVRAEYSTTSSFESITRTVDMEAVSVSDASRTYVFPRPHFENYVRFTVIDRNGQRYGNAAKTWTVRNQITAVDSLRATTVGATTTITADIGAGPGLFPQGIVDFYADGTLLGSAQLEGDNLECLNYHEDFSNPGNGGPHSCFTVGSTATLSTELLRVGSHNLTATFRANGHLLGSTSTVATAHTVTPEYTVSATADSVHYGNSVQVNVRVTDQFGDPAQLPVLATVNETTYIVHAALDGNASISVSESLPVGSYPYTIKAGGASFTSEFRVMPRISEVSGPSRVSFTEPGEEQFISISVDDITGSGQSTVRGSLRALSDFTPTGTITLSDSAGVFASAQLLDGSVQFNVSRDTAGDGVFVATYLGDSIFATSQLEIPYSVAELEPAPTDEPTDKPTVEPSDEPTDEPVAPNSPEQPQDTDSSSAPTTPTSDGLADTGTDINASAVVACALVFLGMILLRRNKTVAG